MGEEKKVPLDVGLEGLTLCLLRGITEHTHARLGHLLLAKGGALYHRGEVGDDGELRRDDHLLETCEQLPITLLAYCWKQTKMVSWEHHPELWTDDLAQPIAWMVQPLTLLGQDLGLLYLEGDDRKPMCAKVVDTYLDTAIRRVARTRETEALERDRDRLEELVRERTSKLEQAQKELVRNERLATLGKLIATVSHELRNPLGTVRGSVFLIANKLLGKDLGVERALDRAERNIVRCDRIIEDLLAYTRTHDLELESVRIDRWLEHTLEEYSFPHDVTVRMQLRSNVVMDVEPERLRRCLINLINNACDAMKAGKSEEEDGSKRLSLVSKINEDKQRLEIAVADSGPGIPEDEIEKIMEPLFSTKSFGVGLGLPTVSQIMEQHKGGLEIKSIVGKGTIMILWVPLDENSIRD